MILPSLPELCAELLLNSLPYALYRPTGGSRTRSHQSHHARCFLPELSRSIADHDVVISLVPFTYHASVVRSAIKGKTNVITTSCVSHEIRSLEQEAKQAGITVLNEVGMDSGIDHLYAVKTIDEVHEKGGKVREQIPGVLFHADQSRFWSSTRTVAVFLLLRHPTTHCVSR